MAKKSLEHKEIVRLIAKLKEETPEYPTELVEARKESFLKQILDISGSGSGQGGEGGEGSGNEGAKAGNAESGETGGPSKSGKPGTSDDSGGSGGSSKSSETSGSAGKGGSGAGPSSGITFLGFSLKSVLAFGAVVVLLTAGYLFRDQIEEYLAENEITNVEETAAPSVEFSLDGQATDTPRVMTTPNSGASSSRIVATEVVPGSESNDNNGMPVTDNETGPTRVSSAQSSGRGTATPTPGPPGDLGSALRFLICILRMGGESCQ